MPDLPTILLFMAAGLALNLTPGPDMLYVLTRSLTQGAGAGVLASTGAMIGGLLHTLGAVAGLSAILLASSEAFAIVKLAGGAYLVLLGLRALLGSRGSLRDQIHAGRPLSPRRIMTEAGVIHALNPKVAIFYLAFLPQFIDPASAGASLGLLTLGLVYLVQAWGVRCVIALGAARVGALLTGRAWIAPWIDRLTGTIFLAFGARLAAASAR